MSSDRERRAVAERFARTVKDNPKPYDAKETDVRIFAKKGEGADAARIIVKPKPKSEDIDVVDPEYLRGRHQDVMIWFCENKTTKALTIELTDFESLFPTENPSAPVEFQNNPIDVPAKGNALIIGTVDRDPKVFEFYKYTVVVTLSNGKVVKHDPDLEIKP